MRESATGTGRTWQPTPLLKDARSTTFWLLCVAVVKSLRCKRAKQGDTTWSAPEAWDPDQHTLGAFRQIEPLKSIFFQPREYFGSTFDHADREPMPERIVIGVKNCDLAGLRIQDYVFGGPTAHGRTESEPGLLPGDPHFVEAREQTILVTCDCTDCLDVCFCPVVGEQPYAEKGYDINISPLSATLSDRCRQPAGRATCRRAFGLSCPGQ